MSFIQAVLLGIMQGITEFLPISSSGHLVLLQGLLGLNDAVALKSFDIAVHFGTLLAILIYFRRDFLELLKALLIWVKARFSRVQKKEDEAQNTRINLIRILVIGTIPALIVGFLWGDWLDEKFLNPLSVCIMLALFALVFLLAEWIYTKYPHKKEVKSWKQGVIIGLAQAVALIPGVSRSGATISTGLLMGIDREKAARFSFLLGSVAMLAATALAVLKVAKNEYSLPQTDILIAGIVSSFGAGWLAISFLMNYLKKHTLAVFAWYRLVPATVLAILWILL
jgi:undecaprenyl-diphosphatase